MTAGASAALVLQAAACLTGDPYAASLLPDTRPERCEIVIQKAHRNRYDGAWRLGGAKLVEIGTARATAAWELEGAIGPRTAAIAYVEAPFLSQPLTLEQMAAIAHQRRVPLIVDAAAEIPPVGNLRRHVAAGADLVALVKPQFEVGPERVGKGGLVKDEAARADALAGVAAFLAASGWIVRETADSPIAGGDGNREYLLWAGRDLGAQRKGPPSLAGGPR